MEIGRITSEEPYADLSQEEFGKAEWRTTDPSTALRSGRDDKGEVATPFRFDDTDDEQQVPPLRYPGFPVYHCALVYSLRRFLRKGPHGPYPVLRGRKSGYAPVEENILATVNVG